MNAFMIDAFEFCRLKQRIENETAVADLPRVAEDTVDKSGVVHWVLQGDNDKFGHPRLMLSVSVVVQLMCQRCLTPFAFNIDANSVLLLAKDEAGIDEIEALADDETIDVIVGSKAFNVLELIEDEVLLAMPSSPKHEICPDQAMLDALKGTQKESPFAILKNLKQ
jgi:uncharacterized protein